MGDPRILVIGGTGAVGRLIVEDLERTLPEASLSAASRNPDVAALPAGITQIRLDIEDADTLRTACKNHDLVIMAAGPFGRFGALVHRACLDAGVDCLDINDSDAAVREIAGLDAGCQRSSMRILTGIGLAPGMTTWMLRKLFMGARHGGGATSPEVLLAGFRRRIPVLRDGGTQEVRTPWAAGQAAFRFPGRERSLDLLPFPSPEALTLPMHGVAAQLGIRSLDHRYHVEFLPRSLARLLAASRLTRLSACRDRLARMMYRSGQKLRHRRDASETTTLIVAPTNERERGLMVHGPISPAYLTASFAVCVALQLLQERKRIAPGVYPFERLDIDDGELERALSRRGIVLMPPFDDAGEHRTWFGHSSPSAGDAASLRHYGLCWYSLDAVPAMIRRKQQACLKRSRLWRELRDRLSPPRLALVMARVQSRRRRNEALLRTPSGRIADERARRQICRDFALFAAGYSEARRMLGPSAYELYAEMFLDSGAMEMAWFWPPGDVIAAATDPAAVFTDYIDAYYAESDRLGVLRREVTRDPDGTLVLSITDCTYATLLAALGCSELGGLVREMERNAIASLAQAAGVEVKWSPGPTAGTAIVELGCDRARAAI
jgi:saccharopine dehydrogenase-like NADP-dependent oxidoreductase